MASRNEPELMTSNQMLQSAYMTSLLPREKALRRQADLKPPSKVSNIFAHRRGHSISHVG